MVTYGDVVAYEDVVSYGDVAAFLIFYYWKSDTRSIA